MMKSNLVNSGVRQAYRQGGAALTDKLLWLAAVAIAFMLVLAFWSDIQFQYRKIVTNMHVGKIVSAASSWKGTRPNYTGMTIGALCVDGYLNESICGTANNAVGTNPFGGNYTSVPNTVAGLLNVTVTMPQDADAVNRMADSMASGTRGECVSRTGCTTLAVTGTTITGTY
jgi:hypothetical protein